MDCSPCGCVTETFGENTTDTHQAVTQDTFLDADNPTRNYGASVELVFDGQPERYLLIQFDLTSIAGSTIIDAALHLFSNGGSQNTSDLYPVLVPWTQGDQDGAAGTPNWDFVEPAVDWGPSGPGAGLEALDLTEEQQAAIEQIRAEAREAVQAAETRQARREIMQAAHEEILAVLTAEQLEQLEQTRAQTRENRVGPLRPHGRR